MREPLYLKEQRKRDDAFFRLKHPGEAFQTALRLYAGAPAGRLRGLSDLSLVFHYGYGQLYAAENSVQSRSYAFSP